MIRFVIPAYNEEENISLLLKRTRDVMEALGEDYEILVLDDGSTDRTNMLLEEQTGKFPLFVVRHPTNLGVGQAFRTGLSAALERSEPEDIIVTKEADNTSDLEILQAIIAKVRAGYDVVLASYHRPEGKIIGSTLDRHILSAGANLLIRTFFPVKGIYTYSSFYRAYRPQILDKLRASYGNRWIEEHGYACMVELVIKLNRLKARIAEVPMILKCDLRKGASKMRRLRTIREYFVLVLREWIRSKVSTPAAVKPPVPASSQKQEAKSAVETDPP